jgi:hypothetical protein
MQIDTFNKFNQFFIYQYEKSLKYNDLYWLILMIIINWSIILII